MGASSCKDLSTFPELLPQGLPQQLSIPHFPLEEKIALPSLQVMRIFEGRGKDKASKDCFLVLTFKEEGHPVVPTSSARDWFRVKQSLQS